MHHALLLTLTTILTLTSAHAIAKNCAITQHEQQQLLAMSYDDFDQKPHGFRRYATENCYHEVALLIDQYLALHKQTLENWQANGLIFHAGQLYAFNSEYEIAKIRFKNAVNSEEPAQTPILWNDYVYATIAFLNHDIAALKRHRENIANGPSFNGKKTNLDVIDRLIDYFGKPYAIAYLRR